MREWRRTKARLAEIKQVKAKLRAEAEREAENIRIANPNIKKKRKVGKPMKADSKDAVAKETGTTRDVRRKMETQVEIAERFPFLQEAPWGREQTRLASYWLTGVEKCRTSVFFAGTRRCR